MSDCVYITVGSKSLYFTGLFAAAMISFPSDKSISSVESVLSYPKLASEQFQEQFGWVQAPVNVSLDYRHEYSFNELLAFAKDFINAQKDLDAQAMKILDDSFWDLV